MNCVNVRCAQLANYGTSIKVGGYAKRATRAAFAVAAMANAKRCGLCVDRDRSLATGASGSHMSFHSFTHTEIGVDECDL